MLISPCHGSGEHRSPGNVLTRGIRADPKTGHRVAPKETGTRNGGRDVESGSLRLRFPALREWRAPGWQVSPDLPRARGAWGVVWHRALFVRLPMRVKPRHAHRAQFGLVLARQTRFDCRLLPKRMVGNDRARDTPNHREDVINGPAGRFLHVRPVRPAREFGSLHDRSFAMCLVCTSRIRASTDQSARPTRNIRHHGRTSCRDRRPALTPCSTAVRATPHVPPPVSASCRPTPLPRPCRRR